MQRLRLQAAWALVIGVGLVGSAGSGSSARAADRPADQILAELEAVEVPKHDPSQRGDTRAMTEFLTKRKAALARKASLIRELFKAYPDHPKLPALFSERWRSMLLTASEPSALTALTAELDEVWAGARDDKLKAEVAFFRSLLAVRSGQGGPEEVLPRVETFIALVPKDERGALLLFSIANQLEGSPRQAELLRRIVANYPDSQSAAQARASLRKEEGLGKPFELAFTDAIKGTSISMKDLKGKVVVIDFWATWCPPCVAEIPKMKDLYAEYHGKGVEFIGVSLDRSRDEGGLDELKQFVARKEITWPQYYQGDYWDSAFSSSWGINAIPAVFVVDPDGNLYSTSARGKLGEIIPELLKKRDAERSGG